MTIHVSQERSPDMAFLLEMLLEAAYPPTASRPSTGEALSEPRLQQWLQNFGTRNGDFAVVAYEEDLPIGAAWCRVFDGQDVDGIVGVVDEGIPAIAIAVHPKYRGRGVGTELLEQLCEVCGMKHFPAISLAVGRSNPALRLYERSGFRVISKEPVLVMRRNLRA